MYVFLLKILEQIGIFGPVILGIISSYLLWNNSNLFFYYKIGIVLSILINILLKGIFKQPRPLDDVKIFNLAVKNGNLFIFKNGIPHDIFGMPSGHSQASIFSTIYIYLALRDIKVLYFFIVISLITIIQRIVSNYHTIFQIIVGGIVGAMFGYYMYYLSQEHIKGVIEERKDDYGPI